MENKIEYKQIPGMMTLEEATQNLINQAENIQRTYISNPSDLSRDMLVEVFEMRKETIGSLLGLIQRYIDQIPDDMGKPVRVRFPMSQEIWNKVVCHEHLLNKKYEEFTQLPSLTVESEGLEDFIVEYARVEDFNLAIAGFEGMVEYERLDSELRTMGGENV